MQSTPRELIDRRLFQKRMQSWPNGRTHRLIGIKLLAKATGAKKKKYKIMTQKSLPTLGGARATLQRSATRSTGGQSRTTARSSTQEQDLESRSSGGPSGMVRGSGKEQELNFLGTPDHAAGGVSTQSNPRDSKRAVVSLEGEVKLGCQLTI